MFIKIISETPVSRKRLLRELVTRRVDGSAKLPPAYKLTALFRCVIPQILTSANAETNVVFLFRR